jgi:undecaprenyl-diphosphatase
MLSLDQTLFLGLNAGPDTAPLVLLLARSASQGEAIGILVLLAVGMAAAPQERRFTPLLTGLTALLLAWCAVRSFRLWIPFPRPAQLGLGMQWVTQGPRPGFPSMHAATAFAIAGTLALRGHWSMTCAAFLWAAMVAWSRVCLGLHFPSDVGAGILTGLACAAAAALLLPRQLRGLDRFSACWSRLAHPWVLRR